jgi:hypothetical protein
MDGTSELYHTCFHDKNLGNWNECNRFTRDLLRKKNMSRSGLGLGLTISRTRNPFVDLVKASNPLAWYRMNESAGPTINDSTTNGRNGTQAGAATVFGQIGAVANDTDKAAKHTVGAGYFTIPHAAWNNITGDMTVLGWIRFWNAAGTADFFTKNAGGYQCYFDGTKLAFYIPGVSLSCTGLTTLVNGTWYRCGWRRSGTTYSVWLNGVQDNSAVDAAAVPATSVNAVTVGNGSLWADEILVYNRALSPAEMLNDYTISKKTAVTIAGVVSQPGNFANWYFSDNSVSQASALTAPELEINVAAGGFLAGGTFQGTPGAVLQVAYSAHPLVGDAYRVNNEPANFSFGTDKYLKNPVSGVLT